MKFEEASKRALAFRDARDWAQFHNPKDLAISISLETSELLEVFQWSGPDVEMKKKRAIMAEELADAVIYCIYLADCAGLDRAEIVDSKIDVNEKKYPVQKSKGNSRKYTEL
jgi:NTP pyrophosphatase (non-canonical NTP hydrolase)